MFSRLPISCISNVASFTGADPANRKAFFATCRTTRSIADCQHSQLGFLLRRFALKDVPRKLVQHVWADDWEQHEVLSAVKFLLHSGVPAEDCNCILQRAARQGFIDVMRLLQSHQVDLLNDQACAMDTAAFHGQTATLQFLLSIPGATPLARGAAPLLAAASSDVQPCDGSPTALKLLLDNVIGQLPAAVEEALLVASAVQPTSMALLLDGRYVSEGPHAGKDVALLEAARRGCREVVAMLVQHQADVHAMQDEALCEAQDPDIIKVLLDAGADVHAQHETPLLAAVTHGHAAVVDLLLDNGADINAQDNSAVVKAACEGHEPVLALLLARGAAVNAQQGLPLIRASSKGHVDCCRALLEVGADVHAQYDSALVAAAHSGHAQVLQMLLSAGADLNAADGGALCTAVAQGHARCVELLLRAGAEVVYLEDDVEALCHAAQGNHTDVLRLLMASGFDAWSVWGTTMLGVCAAQGPSTRDAASLLLQAGVKLPTYEVGDERQAKLEALFGDLNAPSNNVAAC